MNVLVINPGGNSLKAEVVSCDPAEKSASDARYLKSVIVEGIGKEGKLSEYNGKAIAHSEPIEAPDYETAAANIFAWLQSHLPSISDCKLVGVRVVHGGPRFSGPVQITPEVEREIVEFEKWAPLHNQRSIEILPAIRDRFPGVPIFAVFDTAFHRTIPDYAATYAIPYELSQKHADPALRISRNLASLPDGAIRSRYRADAAISQPGDDAPRERVLCHGDRAGAIRR